MNRTHAYTYFLASLLFALMPLRVVAQPVPTATPRVAFYGPLIYGDYVTGSINEDIPAAIYTFDGRAGEEVTITLESIRFRPYLALRDADQKVLITNEAGDEDTSIRIDRYLLPADGTYIIRAGTRGGGAKGGYTLRLDRKAGVQGCNSAYHSH
ncbi:MAG: PPC domain-containing protein [Anaerolineae bacterium]